MNITEQIKNLTQPTLAIIVTETDVKMNKKDVETKTEANPFGAIKKQSTMLVELNPRYEKAVNDQREAEGKTQDFEAKDRTWGTSLGNGLVDNNGKIYVSFIVKENKGTTYFLDGEPIEKKEFERFLPKSKPSTNQGVEQTVIFRTVAVENIKSVEIENE